MRLPTRDLCALAALVAFALGCGPSPEEASTRLDLVHAARAGRFTAGVAHAGAADERALFGDEWYAPVAATGPNFAWVRGRSGSFDLIELEPGGRTRLVAELMPEAGAAGSVVSARIGTAELGEVALERGWQRVEWPLPDGALTAGANRVVLTADREPAPDASGPGRAFALAGAALLGPDELAEGPLPSTPDARSVGVPLRLDAGEVVRFPLYAHAGSRLDLELEAADPSAPAEVRWLARSRAGGPALFDRVVGVDDALALTEDLLAAAGDRLVVELAVLRGSGAVHVRALAATVPRTFTDLVFVVIDTLRADRIHDPEGRIDTPRLDRLASEGVAFTRAYSHANTTLPSHTALFSSRLPSETGVPRNATRVRRDLPLLAEWMGELGYRTLATISMGTLLPVVPHLGVDRGFHHYDTDLVMSMDGYWANERLDPVLDELAADGGPFFLFLHYSDPHAPFHAHGTVDTRALVTLAGEPLARVATPELEYLEREVTLPPGETALLVECEREVSLRFLKLESADGELEPELVEGALITPTRRIEARFTNPGDAPLTATLDLWLSDAPDKDERTHRYDLEVEHVDGAVGAFLDRLSELGLYEEALLVFTSDHGEGLGDHGQGGHGKALFNEQVHVPLVIKPPHGSAGLAALRAAGDRTVAHLDVVPTVLDLVELPPLPGQRGVSLLDATPRPAISESHSAELGDLYVVRDDRWVLMYQAERDSFALFDRENDPGETVDLFAERGSEFTEWQELLRGLASGALEGIGSGEELDGDAQKLLRGLGYTE